MRGNSLSFFFCVWILFGGVAKATTHSGQYLIPKPYKSLLPLGFDMTKAEIIGDFWKVRLDLDVVESFTAALHGKKFGCGGFFEISGEDVKTFFAKKWEKPFTKRSIKYLTESRRVSLIVDKSSYVEALEKITSFSDRSARTESGRKATEWFVTEMKGLAKFHNRLEDLEVHTVETGSGYTQDSVVVKLKGRDGSLPGVLVGAHMDTYARNKPGADDDGSGSAAVMEIFRSILVSKLKFEKDLYFVFYAAEELGLVGSKRVVKEFVQKEIRLDGVLQLDMIGYRSPRNDKAMYFVEDNVSMELTNFTRDLAIQVVGLESSQLGRTRCGYACSDHASWDRKGYSAVLPFEATSRTYNPKIHTGSDVIDRLDMDHAMNFVRLGAAFMTELGSPIVSCIK